MAEESSLKRTRASGEVLDYLLREFENNQTPSPDQRKEISERTNMSEKAVRIWFQNRRAKLRKFERLGKPVKPPQTSGGTHRMLSTTLSRSNLTTNVSTAALNANSSMSPELNEKYCFVDCSSLSVGSWQRIKSGQHDWDLLKKSMVNLSPFTLNDVMTNVDLMVILSRKNNEINYFFSAVSNNAKILFRIFYPVSSVLSCTLLDNNFSKENMELRLNLYHKPKFSVYFFNGASSGLNQWSICDDFSEGQQVSLAFYAPGGTLTPHVLVGVKELLDFLHLFVQENSHIKSEEPLFSRTASDQHSAIAADYPQGDFAINPDIPTKEMLVLDTPEGGFQLKHEEFGLEFPQEAQGELKSTSELDYEDQSPEHKDGREQDYKFKDNEILLGLDENKKDLDQMFPGTPDFFVNPANDHMLARTADTPVIKEDQESEPAATPSFGFDAQPSQSLIYEGNNEAYDFRMAQDYHGAEMLAETPREPTHANTHASGADEAHDAAHEKQMETPSAHVDTFIDYNGDM